MNAQTNPFDHLFESHYFLSDGGMETDMVFNRGIELPCFAAFDLLTSDAGQSVLREYYESYLHLAVRYQSGFILETPTWRANLDWGEKIGYSAEAIAEINRLAIEFLASLRQQHTGSHQLPVLISGNVGPRGDGYVTGKKMTAVAAHAYHSHQITTFASTAADLISAFTLTYVEEALGIVIAAKDAGLPVVISFTVETDGRLPSQQPLGEAIAELDDRTGNYPAYYMVNCAHPTHFENILATDSSWQSRIGGIRGNASKCSHAELDNAEVLDAGDPDELSNDYRRLQAALPRLRVFGGCCGTDLRHIASIANACLPRNSVGP